MTILSTALMATSSPGLTGLKMPVASMSPTMGVALHHMERLSGIRPPQKGCAQAKESTVLGTCHSLRCFTAKRRQSLIQRLHSSDHSFDYMAQTTGQSWQEFSPHTGGF